MFDIEVYTAWLHVMGPMLLVLLILTVLVIISGVLSGLKAGTFVWSYLADFLRTLILPKLGGWLLLEALAFMLGIVPPGTVPAEATTFSAGAVLVLARGAYALLFISLGAKFFTNIKELGVLPEEPQ